MKVRRFLLPLALAAGLAAQVRPQPSPNAPAGPPLKPGSLEGTVTNSLTHAPIPKATVSMASGKAYSRVAITDEGGRFQIGNVEPGRYQVEYVRAQGYLYQAAARSVSSAQIVVAEDQRVTGIALELLPLCAIGGKVVDDAGEPLQDAQVAVMAYDYSSGSKKLVTVDGATTDDRGEYRVFHLKPGRYLVRAWMPPPGAIQHGPPSAEALPANIRRDPAESGYLPVFYPNGSDASQGTATYLPPGGEVGGINFRLHSVPVYHIRGKLEGAGPSQQVFSVIAAPCPGSGASAGAAQYSANIRPDGRFDVAGAGPGVYCLSLTLSGGGRERAYASETVTVSNRSQDGVTLVSQPAFPIPGVVEFDGLAGDPPPLMVGLEATDSMPGTNPLSAQPKDGRFTLTGATPGTYCVKLYRLAPAMYLKSMRYGTEDVSQGLIHLRAGGAALTLVVGTDAGQLSGTVRAANNDPAISLPVTIAPPDHLSNRRDLFRTARTDSAGQFQVTGLAPGEYKIYAWDDPDVPMAEETDFRSAFSTYATLVTIDAKAQATVQVKAIPADEIQRVKERF